MKNNMTVKQLKAEGFDVEVVHERLYRKDGNLAVLMTRKEFVETNGLNRGEDVEFLKNCGGYTRVTISKDGKTSEGKFNVPRNKQFNRCVGLRAALGRALKAL